MSVPSTHCEVKLHGFRRTQDGVVVSFVVHPAEVPKMLALDDLGTRYILALAAIGDDEEPREPPAPQQEGSRPPDTAAFAPQANSGPGGAIQTAKKGKWTIKHGGGWEPGTRPSDPTLEPPEGAIHQKNLARSFAGKRRYAESDDMHKAVTRAVLLAKDPQFQAYVEADSEEEAAQYIRDRCCVGSLRDIALSEISFQWFLEMETGFAVHTGRLAEQRG